MQSGNPLNDQFRARARARAQERQELAMEAVMDHLRQG